MIKEIKEKTVAQMSVKTLHMKLFEMEILFDSLAKLLTAHNKDISRNACRHCFILSGQKPKRLGTN